MNYINVVPKQIFLDPAMPKISKLEVLVSQWEYNEGIVFGIEELFEDGSRNPVGSKTVTLTGSEYLDWEADDAYIYNLIASKLGYTIA